MAAVLGRRALRRAEQRLCSCAATVCRWLACSCATVPQCVALGVSTKYANMFTICSQVYFHRRFYTNKGRDKDLTKMINTPLI